jgi:hypothetical protein
MVKVVDAVLHQISLLMRHEQCQLQAGCSPLCFGSEQSQAAEGLSVEVKLAMACIGQVTAKKRRDIKKLI